MKMTSFFLEQYIEMEEIYFTYYFKDTVKVLFQVHFGGWRQLDESIKSRFRSKYRSFR